MTFFGNTVRDYSVALAIVAIAFVAAKVGNHILRRYLQRWAAKSKTEVDDLVVRRVLPPAVYLVLVGGVWVAKSRLTLAETLSYWIDKVLLVLGLLLAFLILVRFVQGFVDVLCNGFIRRLEETGVEDLEERRRTVERVRKQVREIAGMVLWLLGILTILSNLGVDLKAIWASLGIGGIALVVAVKEPMANLVGRLYIYGTGIFDEGHFIVFGDWGGTVTKIGLFRTNLELFSDMTTVSIPNADFVTGAVKTYYGRTKFMYKWDFDIPYDTVPDKIQELTGRLREHVLAKPEVNAQMCWIYLERLDRYSKVVRVWFQVHLPDWATSLTYGSQVLHEVQDLFEHAGVDFAFPTQTLLLRPEVGTGEGSKQDPLAALVPEVEGQG